MNSKCFTDQISSYRNYSFQSNHPFKLSDTKRCVFSFIFLCKFRQFNDPLENHKRLQVECLSFERKKEN